MTTNFRWLRTLCLALVLAALPSPGAAQDGGASVTGPRAAIPGAPLVIQVKLPEGAAATPYAVRAANGAELASGTLAPGSDKIEGVTIASRSQLPLRVRVGATEAVVAPRYLPAWVSLLPPLLAIALALIFREVIVALFAGVWLGAFFWTGLDPFAALLRSVDTFGLPELADKDHAAIILFSLMLGGMVGVMGRNGGTHGIVERLAPLATTPRRGLIATYLQGLAIFFDDYANTLIVGNTCAR
jgi:hypothetical protein